MMLPGKLKYTREIVSEYFGRLAHVWSNVNILHIFGGTISCCIPRSRIDRKEMANFAVFSPLQAHFNAAAY